MISVKFQQKLRSRYTKQWFDRPCFTLQNMANISKRQKTIGNNRDEDGRMANAIREMRTSWRKQWWNRLRWSWEGWGMVQAHANKRNKNIRAVAEMKMERKRSRERPRLRWKDAVRRDMKAWKIKEEWETHREKWKGLWKPCYPAQADNSTRWEGAV